MSGLAYVDGLVTDLAEAKVPLLDRGYLLGDGVFETLRVSNGHVFRLDAHAARLREGLAALGLDADLEDAFRAAVADLVAAGLEKFGTELYLRVNVTTGTMDDIAGGNGAAITGVCRAFQPYPMQYYAHGVQVVLARQRKDLLDPLARIKHLSFLPFVAARRTALAVTAHDAVLLNTEGRVAEASTSNVFARVGDTVHAPGPDEGALPGVTREAVLELLADTGLDVTERLPLDVLRGADEAWLTNTTGGVVPITRLGDDAIGEGARGELSAHLRNALEDLVRGA